MYSLKVFYTKNDINLSFDLRKNKFFHDVDNLDVLRFLKGTFTNKQRFISRFTDEFRNGPLKHDPEEYKGLNGMIELFESEYDNVEPFTYEEAFKISNQEFQSQVFGSIDITDMIKELGHERIKTAGKAVKHKQFSPSGEFLGFKEYDNVYEVHEVSGKKLGLDEKLYALKCWCTSTNEEHWLWIEDQFKDDPLEAVASTFRIHENLISEIKEIKRQGDVLLVEMKEGSEKLKPEGEMVPLNADQYFSLLTAQS